MSISFACPECRARIEVNEELAGHAGQCPRCQNVIVIPAPNQPIPVPAAPEAPSRGAAKPAARTAAAANEPPARRLGHQLGQQLEA